MRYEDMEKDQLINLLKKKDKLIRKLNVEKEQLIYYATTDCMTNVLNRRAGIELLKEKMKSSKIYGSNLTVCFIDVDDLKKVNDTFGHEIGDRLLIHVSKIIRCSIRKSDILFRIGGDEFLVIFPYTTIEEAKKVWERVHKNIDQANKTESYEYNISLSYGFSEFHTDYQISIEDLIKRADQEMYNKKYKKILG